MQLFFSGFNLFWDEIIEEVLGLDLSDLRYRLRRECDAEIGDTTFISGLNKDTTTDGNMKNLETEITEPAFFCVFARTIMCG